MKHMIQTAMAFQTPLTIVLKPTEIPQLTKQDVQTQMVMDTAIQEMHSLMSLVNSVIMMMMDVEIIHLE